MHAFELLKSDHEQLSRLFNQLDEADAFEDKQVIFDQIKQLWDAHSELEMSTLYPVFENREGFEDMIDQAIQDHQEMKDLVSEMNEVDDEDEFDERIDELVEILENHLDEEENDLFPKIQKEIAKEELEHLSAQLETSRRNFPEIHAA